MRLVRSLGLGFMLGFDVEPDRDLGRGIRLELSLLSASCRCICNLPSPILRFFNFVDQKVTPVLESNSDVYLLSGPRRTLYAPSKRNCTTSQGQG